MQPPRRVRLAVEIALAVFAAALCWRAVAWALRPGQFMILDELSTQKWFLWGPYSSIVHFFPTSFYADRPIGFAFIRLLTDLFGFNYAHQVACQLAVHLANCALALLLFRRLGVGVALSLAGIGLYGSLTTTALTATYIGEAFDVLSLFFLLGSVLAAISERRGAIWASAFLYLAALRSKEFAIVMPILLAILLWRPIKDLARLLWPHFTILAIFGIRYLTLLPGYSAVSDAANPYHPEARLSTVIDSLAYYTASIVSARPFPSVFLAVLFIVVFVWALATGHTAIGFAVAAYILTLLPVCLMPNIRIPYWLYAPGLFLVLAVCLLLQELLARTLPIESRQWTAAVCIALLCLVAATRFRRSPVLWHQSVRQICWRTAMDARAQFPVLSAGTHIYVDHGAETPWLFVPGPCDYLLLVNKQRSISCEINKPRLELLERYDRDRGPKYFVEYHKDGSIAVIARRGPTG